MGKKGTEFPGAGRGHHDSSPKERLGVQTQGLKAEYVVRIVRILGEAARKDSGVNRAIESFFTVLEDESGTEFAEIRGDYSLGPRAQKAWESVAEAIRFVNDSKKE